MFDADYVKLQLVAKFRTRNSTMHIFLNREMMYQVVEDTLFNMGMNGKGCLLRAICEMFQYPLQNHGFFGEVLELFFR